METKSWGEFQQAGLLWWVNRTLHLFGWALVAEQDESSGEILSVFPARVKYRGFSTQSEERGFRKLTKYLRNTSEGLLQDVGREEDANLKDE